MGNCFFLKKTQKSCNSWLSECPEGLFAPGLGTLFAIVLV